MRRQLKIWRLARHLVESDRRFDNFGGASSGDQTERVKDQINHQRAARHGHVKSRQQKRAHFHPVHQSKAGPCDEAVTTKSKLRSAVKTLTPMIRFPLCHRNRVSGRGPLEAAPGHFETAQKPNWLV
jgi:hypothetical protein